MQGYEEKKREENGGMAFFLCLNTKRGVEWNGGKRIGGSDPLYTLVIVNVII